MMGQFRAKTCAAAFALALAAALGATAANAAGEAVHIDRQPWSFGGIFGNN